MLVFPDNLSVCFDTGYISRSVVALGGDPVSFARVLVNPLFFEPFARIRIVRGNEMESFRICSQRMAERADVAGLEKIERLDLLRVGLLGI